MFTLILEVKNKQHICLNKESYHSKQKSNGRRTLWIHMFVPMGTQWDAESHPPARGCTAPFTFTTEHPSTWKRTTKGLECHAINIKASIHHSIWMGLKVLRTTPDWWRCGWCGARRRQTWSSSGSSPKENTGGEVEIVQRGFTACWFHPWLKTPVML